MRLKMMHNHIMTVTNDGFINKSFKRLLVFNIVS